MGDSLRGGVSDGSPAPCFDMSARRLRSLSRTTVLGREVPVATGVRSRLLGLALLRRRRAGAGLLIPRCAGVHTVGMLFALDLYFLDRGGRVLHEVRGVRPFRFLRCREAESVLELVPGLPPRLNERDPG